MKKLFYLLCALTLISCAPKPNKAIVGNSEYKHVYIDSKSHSYLVDDNENIVDVDSFSYTNKSNKTYYDEYLFNQNDSNDCINNINITIYPSYPIDNWYTTPYYGYSYYSYYGFNFGYWPYYPYSSLYYYNFGWPYYYPYYYPYYFYPYHYPYYYGHRYPHQYFPHQGLNTYHDRRYSNDGFPIKNNRNIQNKTKDYIKQRTNGETIQNYSSQSYRKSKSSKEYHSPKNSMYNQRGKTINNERINSSNSVQRSSIQRTNGNSPSNFGGGGMRHSSGMGGGGTKSSGGRR